MGYAYADKQTIIKADVSLTSTSEKHIANLATIFWPLEQTPQQVNSDVTQVHMILKSLFILYLYSMAQDRCVNAR